MRYYLSGLICTIISLCQLSAQDVLMTPLSPNLCNPGVMNSTPSKGILIEYGSYPNYRLNTRLNGENQNNTVNKNTFWNFKLKAPIILKPGLKILVGAAHMRENYDFGSIDPNSDFLFRGINDRTLNISRLGVYIIKPINDRFYTSFKLETSQNGDFKQLFNFEKRYAIYRAIGMVGFKPTPYKEWGFGVMARSGFRKNQIPVLPLLIYNQTFNEKWGIEFAVPVRMRVRYNHDEKNIFVAGTEFNNRQYSINLTDDAQSVFHARTSRLELGVEYMRQLHPWIWFSVKGGYAHNFRAEFENTATATSTLPDVIQATATGGPFFRVGIFVSPARKK